MLSQQLDQFAKVEVDRDLKMPIELNGPSQVSHAWTCRSAYTPPDCSVQDFDDLVDGRCNRHSTKASLCKLQPAY